MEAAVFMLDQNTCYAYFRAPQILTRALLSRGDSPLNTSCVEVIPFASLPHEWLSAAGRLSQHEFKLKKQSMNKTTQRTFFCEND